MNKPTVLDMLNDLRRTWHTECDDAWYSCPKSDEGCANDDDGDECTCGMDEHNQAIDNIISAINLLDL